MSQSRKERPLFDEKDYNFHGVPVYHNDPQAQVFADDFPQLPYPTGQFMYPPQFYPDPMIEQMPYNQYPPAFYYAPPPVQISQTPFNKTTTYLPPAPKGRIPLQSTLIPSTPAVINYPFMSTPAQPFATSYMVPEHDQPTLYYSPPSARYHAERVPLPRIPQDRRRSHSEHDYHNRSHHEPPLIMSYFGRRYDIDQSHVKTRWYH